jgi:hypothetical protein
VADGTRIVVVDAQTVLRDVQEGDRFAVDGVVAGDGFRIVSVGFHRPCLEIDRPLPAGRYGWSIQRAWLAPQAEVAAESHAGARPTPLSAASVSARRSGNTTGDDSAELPNGDAARGPAALRDAGETLAIDAPLIVSCGTPQVMTLQPSLAEAAAERWRPSARRWHVAPAELTSATLSRFASRSDEGTGRGERAARADSPGQRFDGRTRWWRFGPHDPYLCDDTEKAEGNEATFAFRLRRSARVIRPETLMMARDQTSGETFRIRLLPAVGGTCATEAGGAFDLELTARSGETAVPVRWTVNPSADPARWRFLALVTDRQGGVSLWVDGQWHERQMSTLGIRQHDELSIGDQLPGMGRSGLDGLLPTGLRDTTIDEVAVWSRPLVHVELMRAMEDSPRHATRDGSLQLYWSSVGPTPDPTGAWRFPFSAAEHWVLDASGTLRHGVQVTVLQAVQQAWDALLDSYRRGGQAVGIGPAEGEVFRFDTSQPLPPPPEPARSPPSHRRPSIARLGFCQIDEAGPWLGLPGTDGSFPGPLGSGNDWEHLT